MKLCSIVLLLLSLAAAPAAEVYELKIYHLNSAEDASEWDSWMSSAGLANLKKSGAVKVGAFKTKPTEDEDEQRFVLAVYPSLAAMQHDYGQATLEKASDSAAEAYLAAPPDQEAYSRIESSLLMAFPSFTQLVDPPGEGNGERFFELRTYESRSERTAALKVEMFGEGGEIDVFREVGLTPVFFGSARIASNLPQLTYMVVHENEDAMGEAWKSFGTSEGWNKLKGNTRYAGTVSKVNRRMLVALPFSEIK